MRRTSVSARMVLAAVLALATVSAVAEPRNVTDGEIALLPVYCRDKEWNGGFVETFRKERWIAELGNSWKGVHHYCWALVNIRRAQLTVGNSAERRYLIEVAISDYFYAVENSTSDFRPLPEIYLRLGEAYELLEQYAQAIKSYETASSLKPDYWPAYQRHAETLIKLRLNVRAKQVIELGLRMIPDQPMLVQLKNRIDGAAAERRVSPPKADTAGSESSTNPGAGSPSKAKR